MQTFNLADRIQRLKDAFFSSKVDSYINTASNKYIA